MIRRLIFLLSVVLIAWLVGSLLLESSPPKSPKIITEYSHDAPQPVTASVSNPILGGSPEFQQKRSLQKPQEITKIRQCNFEQYMDEFAEQADVLEQQKQTFLASLGTSSDPNKQLVHALFYGKFENNNRIEPLAAFHRKFPDNPDVLRHLLGQCERQPEHNACGESLLKQVIKHHGSNGAYWLQIANYYAKQGKTDAILEALRNAINAPYFDEDYFDSIRLFLEASEGELEQPFAVRATTAWGYQAAEPLYVGQVLAYCFTHNKQAAQGTNLCLDLAETLQSRSKIILNRNIASALTHRSKLLNEDEENALKDKVEWEQKHVDLLSDDYFHAANLSFFDSTLFYQHLEILEQVGEEQAINFLTNEAITLSKNPYYNPCP